MKSNLFNRVKEFFKRVFKRESSKLLISVENTNYIKNKQNNNFKNSISARDEVIALGNKRQMAQKLLTYEVFPVELTEEETDDMIEYFKKDIDRKDKELEKTKQNILLMKKQLETTNQN